MVGDTAGFTESGFVNYDNYRLLQAARVIGASKQDLTCLERIASSGRSVAPFLSTEFLTNFGSIRHSILDIPDQSLEELSPEDRAHVVDLILMVDRAPILYAKLEEGDPPTPDFTVIELEQSAPLHKLGDDYEVWAQLVDVARKVTDDERYGPRLEAHIREDQLAYFTGGRGVDDEKIRKVIADRFDITFLGDSRPVFIGKTKGGLTFDELLGIKDPDDAIQFVATENTRNHKPDFVPMYAGHVPKKLVEVMYATETPKTG